MPRHQRKNKTNNIQGSISSLEPNYQTATGPEYSDIAETHQIDFKTPHMNIIDALKEEIHKSLNKIWEKKTMERNE